MKKKIVGILVCTLLIAAAALPVVVSTYEKVSIKVYDEISVNEDCGCESSITTSKDTSVYWNPNNIQEKDAEKELMKIRKAIEVNNADWIADYTSVSNSTFYMQGGGLGCIYEDIDEDDYEDVSYPGYVPDEFDWRDVDGTDWTTSIKDQKQCGSCTAFGSIAALEAVVQIEVGYPFGCDLSEAHLFFCIGGGCDSGSSLSKAMAYIKGSGVSDESCFPYEPYDMPCSQKCSNWKQRAMKALQGGYITPTVSNLKNALLQYGPLITSMEVYEDFYSYRSGVYEHVSGLYEGRHCVAIVGYNDTIDYWICKNSWGTNWGENGWFRIKFGQCNIRESTRYLSGISGNIQPAAPYDPFPSSGSNSHNIDVTLSWNCNDPNGDLFSFDVYFGTGFNPPLVSADQTTMTYDPGPLSLATTYCWKIIVEDEHGSKNGGQIWKFSTNKPPYRPSRPSGPASGQAGKEYNYSSLAIEPDGNQIYYMFDWGDSTDSGWLGPFDSGEVVEVEHAWTKEGNYEVKVKAKDIHGAESEWSEPLSVSMSKSKPYFNTPFLQFLENLIQRFPLFAWLLQHPVFEKLLNS